MLSNMKYTIVKKPLYTLCDPRLPHGLSHSADPEAAPDATSEPSTVPGARAPRMPGAAHSATPPMTPGGRAQRNLPDDPGLPRTTQPP